MKIGPMIAWKQDMMTFQLQEEFLLNKYNQTVIQEFAM
jgi:hypothetical protein